jgi:hypothetical protein
MMRRDRIMECTIATVVGIGLAAGLTASLGVRSAGAPTPLEAEVSTPAKKPVISPSEVPRKHTVRKRAARTHHRRARAHAPAPPPVVANAPPAATPRPARPRPIRIQPVSAPAPAPAPKPAPPKLPSRPKPSGSKGISFDDSG